MKRSVVICLVALVPLGACKKKTESTETETVAENVVGVTFYPKSTEWGTGSSAGKDGGNAASARQTDDAPEKVIEFYKKEIKEAKVSSQNLGDIVHTTVTGKTKDGAEAEVLVMKMPSQKTQIFISVKPRK
jgi:hypothetical protein